MAVEEEGGDEREREGKERGRGDLFTKCFILLYVINLKKSSEKLFTVLESSFGSNIYLYKHEFYVKLLRWKRKEIFRKRLRRGICE